MKKIILDESAEKRIDHLIESGIGENAEQVISIAVKYLDDQETAIKSMRPKVEAGMEEIYNGDIIIPEGSVQDTHKAYEKRRAELSS